jgi:hypothetical protein
MQCWVCSDEETDFIGSLDTMEDIKRSLLFNPFSVVAYSDTAVVSGVNDETYFGSPRWFQGNLRFYNLHTQNRLIYHQLIYSHHYCTAVQKMLYWNLLFPNLLQIHLRYTVAHFINHLVFYHRRLSFCRIRIHEIKAALHNY